MNVSSSFYQRESFVYFTAFIASLLLSLWIVSRVAIINPDAVCYVMGAEVFGQSGIKSVLSLCTQSKWPFYSVLIYEFVKWTPLSFVNAAYVLDAFFTLGSVLSFILIVKELGGSRRVLWLALFVILFSHGFNSVREYIIRDHGFWFFYLLSLLFLLRYFKTPHLKIALGFSASLMLATLFRVEGIIFLLLLPLVAWAHRSFSFKQRLQAFMSLSGPSLMIGILFGLWFLLHPHQSTQGLGRIPEVINQFRHGIAMMIERYVTMKSALAQHVLTADSARDAGLVILIVLFVWYVLSVCSNLTVGYAALFIYALIKRIRFQAASSHWVLNFYLSINILITFIFLFEHLFLSKRYLIALSLIFMLWVPFALDDLIQKWGNFRHRLFLLMVSFILFISSISGIFDFGDSKYYVYAGGNWLAEHVPRQAKLYLNDYQLTYYSKHFGSEMFNQFGQLEHVNIFLDDTWKKYDYLAFRIRRKEKDQYLSLLKAIPFAPLQVFNNKKGGDQVVIYKVN